MACDPGSISRSCTPFAYVTDGCTARAHHMCEQLLLEGVTPGKVWLETWKSTQPQLCPESPNSPCCIVDWSFHVAPILLVRTPIGNEWRVIDPALFDEEERVPNLREWRARQRDGRARFFFTEATVYHKELFFDRPDFVDPDFRCSPKTLRTYRALLASQVANSGLPPYC